MKRKYVTPVASEELFVANQYVAGCAWQITSTSGNNRMQCANPSHRHYMDGTYFTSVWVAATNSTCQIIVSEDGIGKTALAGNNAQPAYNATVYGETGTQYTCTKSRSSGGIIYYVPSFVPNGDKRYNSSTSNPCYGTYVNTGDYNEIKEKVFS